jgi:hypothetical protein
MRVYWVVPLVDQLEEPPVPVHVLARVHTLPEPEREHTASTVQVSAGGLVPSVEEEAHMVSLIYVADQAEAQQAVSEQEGEPGRRA